MTTMQRFDPFQDLRRFRRLLNSPLWAGQRWPGQQAAGQQAAGQQAAGQQAAGQRWPAPFAPGAAPPAAALAIPMDVRRDDRQLTVQASLPGFAPDDVAVTISPDRTLTIKASRPTAAGGADDDKFLLRERHSGSFARAIRLPADLDLDAAAVSLEHGVLTVTAPVAAAAQTRRLPIGADAVDTGNPGNPAGAATAAADAG